jgi:hypothetical protein
MAVSVRTFDLTNLVRRFTVGADVTFPGTGR